MFFPESPFECIALPDYNAICTLFKRLLKISDIALLQSVETGSRVHTASYSSSAIDSLAGGTPV